MDVLVIGGTRYFGRGAVQQLLEAGHAVTIFSRGSTRPPFWNDIEHIEGDHTDSEGMAARLKGRRFDGVIDNLCFNREEAEGDEHLVPPLHGDLGTAFGGQWPGGEDSSSQLRGGLVGRDRILELGPEAHAAGPPGQGRQDRDQRAQERTAAKPAGRSSRGVHARPM